MSEPRNGMYVVVCPVLLTFNTLVKHGEIGPSITVRIIYRVLVSVYRGSSCQL